MTSVKDKYPPPHTKYLVNRGGFYFTATPCYGMHNPWWVVRIMNEDYSYPPAYEVPPVSMNEDDYWMPISEVILS